MGKRFTDTDKWKKRFIKGLPPEYKLFWFYILDDCDHSGIWHVDFEVAEIRVGKTIDQSVAGTLFEDKIKVLDDGEKWFIPSFIEFQYGELSEKCNPHIPVIKTLKKYNLYEEYIKGYINPLRRVKEKEKEKDQEQVKEKDMPSKSVFMEYAKFVCEQKKFNFDGLEFSIETKYDSWVGDGWFDGHGNKIRNWQNKLRAVLPHLKEIKKHETRSVAERVIAGEL